ncbi:hypothetical protein C8R42DRAFT_757192 [Lentinula raphanica]|nr:hypothetical protein C8R42DRAFT_757192 [Lentinula raphanica]
MLVPNELLYSITEYIAYTPKLPGSSSKSLYQCPSPELLALSVANWPLRRICLPFLFANVEMKHDKDAEALTVIGHFSSFTKILVIGGVDTLTESGDRIISRMIPQLKQLFYVELQSYWKRTVLLREILGQPTVTTVLVHEPPPRSMYSDELSKMILDRQILPWYTDFRKYLNWGMRLICLELFRINAIGNFLVSQTLSGLQTLELHMDVVSVSFSWLSSLLSTYPSLNELWLIDGRGQYCAHDVPPSLSSLFKQIQPKDPHDIFAITRAGLRRAKPFGQFSQDWYFSGLTFHTPSTNRSHHRSLIEGLAHIASSFPNLETLSLSLGSHWGMYDIDNLVSAFARFTFLRVVFLGNVFSRLKFGSENEKLRLMSPVQELDSKAVLKELGAHAESGLTLFSSHLAKQIRTLDSIHIDDMGFDSDDNYPTGSWYLNGWLHVLNGNRDVGGRLATSFLSTSSLE